MNRQQRREQERQDRKASKKRKGKQGMISLQTPVGAISITDEDYQKLFQANPLALEQIKGIVLARQMAAMSEELAGLKADAIKETAKEEPEKREAD